MTVAVAVGVLTLAVAFVAGRPTGGRQAAVGLVIGCGLSVGLQLLLGTWDALWQPGWSGWIVAVVLGASVVGTARGLAAFTTTATQPTGRPRRLWALGPFLAVAAMIVANPAFAASQSGTSLRTAGIVLVAANFVGAGLLLRPAQWSAPWRVGAAVLVVVGVAGALWISDVWALVAVAVLELAVGVVLAAALSAHRPAPRGIPRTASATIAVGVLTIGPLLLYMLDYDVPLRVDNVWVVVLTALALGLSGLRRRTPLPGPSDRLPRSMASVRLLLLPALVLATIGLVALSTPSVPAHAAGDSLTLVDWNLHYGVSPLTGVDLEAHRVDDRGAAPRRRDAAGGRARLDLRRRRRHGHVAVAPARHDDPLRARGRPPVRQRGARPLPPDRRRHPPAALRRRPAEALRAGHDAHDRVRGRRCA